MSNPTQTKQYTEKELQLCLRLSEDNAVMDWLREQAEFYLELFPVIDPANLPKLQAQHGAVKALIARIEYGVKYVEHRRNSQQPNPWR